jgi:hypothetical protein
MSATSGMAAITISRSAAISAAVGGRDIAWGRSAAAERSPAAPAAAATTRFGPCRAVAGFRRSRRWDEAAEDAAAAGRAWAEAARAAAAAGMAVEEGN